MYDYRFHCPPEHGYPIGTQLEHYAPDYSGEFIADKTSLFKPLEVPDDVRAVTSGLSVADFLSRLAETPAVAALLAGKPASHLRLREKTYNDSAGKIYSGAHCFKTDIALDYQKLPFLVEILPGVFRRGRIFFFGSCIGSSPHHFPRQHRKPPVSPIHYISSRGAGLPRPLL